MLYQLKPPSTMNSYMSITLSLYGEARRLRLHFRWHEYLSKWRLAVYEATGECLISDIPLVSGADLLKPYPHLRLGHLYILPKTDLPPSPDPLSDGLQEHFWIIWGDE